MLNQTLNVDFATFFMPILRISQTSNLKNLYCLVSDTIVLHGLLLDNLVPYLVVTCETRKFDRT